MPSVLKVRPVVPEVIATEPFAFEQVGWVSLTVGADGVIGCALITAFSEAAEVHPSALVTVKVYVLLAARPLNSAVVPVPGMVVEPTVSVTVHEPEAGNPLNATLPVAVAQVGWVIIPAMGAEGVVFGAAMPEPGKLVQPSIVWVTV